MNNSDEIFSFILCHLVFLGKILFVGYIDDESIKFDNYNREINYQNYYLTLTFYILIIS